MRYRVYMRKNDVTHRLKVKQSQFFRRPATNNETVSIRKWQVFPRLEDDGRWQITSLSAFCAFKIPVQLNEVSRNVRCKRGRDKAFITKIIRSFYVTFVGGILGVVVEVSENSGHHRKLMRMSRVYGRFRWQMSHKLGLKCLIARCFGRISCSNALYVDCADCSLPEKNGCAATLAICCYSVPTAALEAPVRISRTTSSSVIVLARMDTFDKAPLAVCSVLLASGVKENFPNPF